MDDEYPELLFLRQLLVYSNLLGVYLIILGIGLAGLVSVLKKQRMPLRKEDAPGGHL
jgi:hypothetical protein